jgi:hypothetical protein
MLEIRGFKGTEIPENINTPKDGSQKIRETMLT